MSTHPYTLVPLTRGYEAIIDRADEDIVLASSPWHARPHGRTFCAARKRRLPDGRRQVLALHTFLTGYALTDHINGNGLDNRRSNLREATQAQNTYNRRKNANNTSGYMGVSWHKRSMNWQASLGKDGKLYSLGGFSDPKEAAMARDEAALRYYGEFANLNFPLAAAPVE